MEREQIHTCTELWEGDSIEALEGDILRFTGVIVEVQTTHELFWAVDSVGCRKLIDLASYIVLRLGVTIRK